jgi:hypothetical protein
MVQLPRSLLHMQIQQLDLPGSYDSLICLEVSEYGHSQDFRKAEFALAAATNHKEKFVADATWQPNRQS